MHRSFTEDLDPDITFEFGGENFKVRYPHHSEWDPIFEEDTKRSEALASGEMEQEPTKVVIQRIGKRISNLYIASTNGDAKGTADKKRFMETLNDKTKPVTLFTVTDLWNWLQEVTSGPRPTNLPTPSEPGPGETEPSSKVVSR